MCYEYLEERVVRPGDESEIMVRDLLAQFGMVLDMASEYTTAFYFQDKIVATGSLVGATFCNIAVDPEFQGEGLAARVVSNLISEAGRRGRYRYLVKADSATEDIFLALGFVKITHDEPCGVLLAMGPENY